MPKRNNKSRYTFKDLNVQTDDSEDLSLPKHTGVNKALALSVQPKAQQISTKTLLTQKGQLEATQCAKKTKKYNFAHAQSTQLLDHYLLEFSRHTGQEKYRNFGKTKESKNSENNEIQGTTDEKLEQLQVLHQRFPLKYLLHVWNKNPGKIDKVYQFLNQYAEIFNEPQIKVNKPEKVQQHTNSAIKQANKKPQIRQEQFYYRKKDSFDSYGYTKMFKANRILLEEVFQLRYRLNQTAKNISNTYERNKIYQQIESLNYNKIDKISVQSIQLLTTLTSKSSELSADIHGMRDQECLQLLQSMENMILSQYKKKNPIIKPLLINTKLYAKLTLITGPGGHSKGRQSELKKQIKRLCGDEYPNKTFTHGIDVFIMLN